MIEYGSVLDGNIVPGDPLVSVSVITYNHGKYIRECLDGILMQKVNFPYEVLIHDDASPDDTAHIIHEYEVRFPTIIKPIYRTENQYSQGKDVGKFNLDRAKGKYIAQCEGDDYWIDPNKLQIQVDFLENHPEYVETGHNIKILTENGFIQNRPYDRAERRYSIKDLISGKKWDVATASAVYRNIFKTIDPDISKKYYDCNANGDLKLSYLLAQFGCCYIFKNQMSVYRYVTSNGTSYNAQARNKNMAKKRYNAYLSVTQFMKETARINIDYRPLLSYAFLSCISDCIFKRDKDNLKILKYIVLDLINRFKGISLLIFILIFVPLQIIQKISRMLAQ